MSKIQVRRGTATDWALANTVLASGEPGLDTTNGILKVGDGATPWGSLAVTYASGASVAALQAQVVPTAWTVPAFVTGWGQYGGFSTVSYRKIGDLVYLRGLLNSVAGAVAGVAFTLPVGFRPPTQCLMACYCSPGTMRRVDITAGGGVTISSVTVGEWFALDSMPPFSVTP
jgi:hypothetical protein